MISKLLAMLALAITLTYFVLVGYGAIDALPRGSNTGVVMLAIALLLAVAALALRLLFPDRRSRDTEIARYSTQPPIEADDLEGAYNLGLKDIGSKRFVGKPPGGLFFLMPYAVAVMRNDGQCSKDLDWPAYTSLDSHERKGVELIHACLVGSTTDVDAVLEFGDKIGLALYEPMYILFRANERHWGLEPAGPAETSFSRIYEAPARKPRPKRFILKSRLDDGSFDASARCSAVRIVRSVLENRLS